VAVEIDHLEAIKRLVQSGIGVAILPAWAARDEIASGALASARLGPRGFVRAWGLLYPDHAPLPILLRTVVAELTEMLPSLFARATSIDSRDGALL